MGTTVVLFHDQQPQYSAPCSIFAFPEICRLVNWSDRKFPEEKGVFFCPRHSHHCLKFHSSRIFSFFLSTPGLGLHSGLPTAVYYKNGMCALPRRFFQALTQPVEKGGLRGSEFIVTSTRFELKMKFYLDYEKVGMPTESIYTFASSYVKKKNIRIR